MKARHADFIYPQLVSKASWLPSHIGTPGIGGGLTVGFIYNRTILALWLLQHYMIIILLQWYVKFSILHSFTER